MKTIFTFLILNILSFIAGCFIFYFLFDWFNPPITEDGHPYMPIENVMCSVIAAFVSTILFFIFIRKYIAENF